MILSFFIISKVRDFQTNPRLVCLWLLGSEETESVPVCLCDSGAKIIPLGNARVGKPEVVYSPFNNFFILTIYFTLYFNQKSIHSQ